MSDRAPVTLITYAFLTFLNYRIFRSSSISCKSHLQFQDILVVQSVYRVDSGLEDRGSIPGRGNEIFFSSPPRAEWTRGPAQPPVQWVPKAISPGVKRPGSEADRLPPSTAEVKNT
jgi:hypothetical protein